MRINYEAIYQALYIQRPECLGGNYLLAFVPDERCGLPRERARSRGKSFLTDALMISDRPSEIDLKSGTRPLGR